MSFSITRPDLTEDFRDEGLCDSNIAIGLVGDSDYLAVSVQGRNFLFFGNCRLPFWFGY